MINFIRIYFSRVFFVLLVILSICLLFTIIKITVLSHIFYLYRFKTVALPWRDPNALRYVQNSRYGVAILEKRINTQEEDISGYYSACP